MARTVTLSFTIGILCLSAALKAGTIVGIGNAGTIVGPSGGPGLSALYSVDPLTGNVTSLRSFGSGAYAISTGPYPQSFFILSPVNHYLLTYQEFPNTGSGTLWDSYCPTCQFPLGDYAFDSSTQKLFALTDTRGSAPVSLAILEDTGNLLPGAPGSHMLSPTYINSALPASLSLIEYIDGFGLYATNGHAAYRIDESTGVASALPNLSYSGPTITGLAYDPASGSLIGVSGVLDAAEGTTSVIYKIDPSTGAATVLNSDAPDIFGLATITLTPEPSSMLSMLFGIVLLNGIRLKMSEQNRKRSHLQ